MPPKRKFAEGTSVSIPSSRTEIEKILARYGAEAFGYGQDGNRVVVTFRAHGRVVRFEVNLPPLSAFERDGQGYRRAPGAAQTAQEKEHRRVWRALALAIKAKLEAVESGLFTFEEEFMAHVVLPNNETVGRWLEPQVATAYETGDMPALLPGGAPALTRGSR